MATWRENHGLHADTLTRFLRATVFNEALTLPLAGAALYLSRPSSSSHLSTLHLPFSASDLSSLARIPLYLGLTGLLITANRLLTKWTLNNYTFCAPDEWTDWSRELVLVTGGSSGIGARVIQLLLAKNPRTKIIIVDYSPLSWSIPDSSKSNVHFYRCDLSDPNALRSVCATIKSEVGNPTVLFNNAGLGRGKTLLEGSHGDTELTIKTNLIAPFLLCKEFLPDMAAKNHGHIINVSSLASLFSPVTLVDYAATKAGMTTLYEGLLLELHHQYKASRVRVSNCLFGFVDSPLISGMPRQNQFLLPLLKIDTVAEEIVNVLYSGYGRTLYMPNVLRVMAILRGAAPEWMFRPLKDTTADMGVELTKRHIVDEKTGQMKVTFEEKKK